MSLTQQQYDNIMLDYSRKRDLHWHEQRARQDKVYQEIPAYRDLEKSIPDLSLSKLDELLSGNSSTSSVSLKDQINEISQKKEALLLSHGYPKDYLEMQYDCPDCKDTGYIDGQKCHCLRQKEIQIAYNQSNLSNLFLTNNFSLLSEEYVSGPARERLRGVVAGCRSFVKKFDSDYENLYIYGTVGTGKSFLSICVAKEILEMGHSVLYFSAAELFDRLASAAFNRANRTDFQDLTNDLYHCDLLIIDDLGTEVPNNFVAEQLFTCVNERNNNRKATIINSNLDLANLQARYSDRIVSRILNMYSLYKLEGPDIRMLKH